VSRRLALVIALAIPIGCGGAPFTEDLGSHADDAGALEAPDAHYNAQESAPAYGPDGGASGEAGGGGKADGSTETREVDAGPLEVSDGRMALDASQAPDGGNDGSLCCVTGGCFRVYWPVPLPSGTAGWSNDYAGGTCAPGLAGYGYCQGTVQAGACRGDY